MGAGSWGTALSVAVADRGLEVTLYGNEDDVRDDINANNQNSKYLPGVDLPTNIGATTDISEIINAPLILMVVPSQVARLVLTQLKEAGVSEDTIILSCTKGIDPNSMMLMHATIQDVLPNNPVAVLSGPSHAEEVARRLATLATVGAEDQRVSSCNNK
ncbi:MAG: hypothetical protein AAF226_16065 [Verrucomicrobiota bacterium]